MEIENTSLILRVEPAGEPAKRETVTLCLAPHPYDRSDKMGRIMRMNNAMTNSISKPEKRFSSGLYSLLIFLRRNFIYGQPPSAMIVSVG